ncbi:hypothetical protein [Solimonas marina]|uniref:Uncharacterized protein n=1 Tax=Solimonas marina TaxID=2714601 RepID=A0A970B524_9GAMM|nr:hypothetical protein [Solimonas marina]NKF21110.1 hypothetical protein [Solimonas marina]
MEVALVVLFIVAIIAAPFATLYLISTFRRRKGEKLPPPQPYDNDGPDGY